MAGDLAEDLAFLDGRGPLELHVLDPVGNAGKARDFIATAHPVEDPKGHQRRGMILPQEHLEAVVEHDVSDRGGVTSHASSFADEPSNRSAPQSIALQRWGRANVHGRNG